MRKYSSKTKTRKTSKEALRVRHQLDRDRLNRAWRGGVAEMRRVVDQVKPYNQQLQDLARLNGLRAAELERAAKLSPVVNGTGRLGPKEQKEAI